MSRKATKEKYARSEKKLARKRTRQLAQKEIFKEISVSGSKLIAEKI